MKPEKSRVHIEVNPSPERFQHLVFSSGFKKYEGYTSLYTRKQDLECFVVNKGRVVLALLDNQIIIGFAVLDRPDETERWAKLGGEIVLALKAVEVLRGQRNQGIAGQMLTRLFADAGLEDKIVYLTAYSWTWDLECSRLSLAAYRTMLINLYAGFGFTTAMTNDPNICLKPENIFMVRKGKNVFQTVQKKFKWLRFGVSV